MSDLPFLLQIYNDVVQHSAAIYEDHERDLTEQQEWFECKRQQAWPVLVATVEGKVVAYGTLGVFRPQSGFATTAEHSLYISEEHRGKGLGTQILTALIAEARERKFHALIAAVDAGNESSLRLHHRFNFFEVGRLPQVARKFDRWLDLVFLQLTLEREIATVLS